MQAQVQQGPSSPLGGGDVGPLSQQPMGVGKVLLTINKLFDLPRPCTELDPLMWNMEIVMKIRVKYYHKGMRLTCLDLRDEVISFLPSNILFQQDRFTVDFNSPTAVNLSGRDPTTASGSGGRHSGNHNHGNESHGASIVSKSNNNSTSSGAFQNVLTAGADAGAGAGGGFYRELNHTDNEPAAVALDTSSPEDTHIDGGNSERSAGGGLPAGPGRGPGSSRVSKINNKVLILYPSHPSLKAIVEVAFGVRERRKDSSSAVRWLTPITTFDMLNPESRGHAEQMKTSNAFAFQGIEDMVTTESTHLLSFAEREIQFHKVVQRFVGLKAGHLSVTVSLPHVRDDLRRAKYYHEHGELFYFDPVLMNSLESSAFSAVNPCFHFHDGPCNPGTNYYMHNRYESIALMDLAEDVIRLNSNPLALQRYRARLMKDAALRLRQDCERLAQQYDTQRSNPAAHAALTQSADVQRLLRQLEAGESEYGIYRSLLLACDRSFFVRRVQRLCEDYPPTDAELENIKSVSSNGLSIDSASLATPTVSPIPVAASPLRLGSTLPYGSTLEKLLEEYTSTGNEEELIRLLSVEMGPERRSMTPRVRYASFLQQYGLKDEKVRAHTAEVFAEGHNVLDSDPDLYMHYLEQSFRKKEAQPRLYNFAKIQYSREERGFFASVLHFPTEAEVSSMSRSSGGGGGDSSDITYAQLLLLREHRMPLQLTPYERPLVPRDPNSHRAGEIDILLDKYKPEFHQIIPSIVTAVKQIVTTDEAVWREMRGSQHEKMDVLFQVFNDHNAYSNRNSVSSGGGGGGGGGGSGGGRSGEFDEVAFRKFLIRLTEYTYTSPSSLLASVIYLDRLSLRYPYFCMTRYNVERLFVGMLRISSKVVDLRSVNNRNFANVFRMPTLDMNFFEERLLKLMDFDLFLSPEEFLSYTHLLDPRSTVGSSGLSSIITGNKGRSSVITAPSRGVHHEQ